MTSSVAVGGAISHYKYSVYSYLVFRVYKSSISTMAKYVEYPSNAILAWASHSSDGGKHIYVTLLHWK